MLRWIAASLLTFAAAASANDTTASTGAGGLVIERTSAIDMASEDLFISAAEIRIRYIFRNRAPRTVSTIVAFPMPDRDLSSEYGGDVGYPSGFRTRVGGRPVTTRLERKAMVKGRDHSALLKRLGVPLAPESINDATRAMDRLAPADQRRLVALGLAGEEEYDDTGKGMKRHLIPLWTVQDRHYWTQVFPAGRDLIVDHRYVPGVGGSADTPIAFDSYRKSAEAKQTIARYCMDSEFLAAIDRRAGKDPMKGPGMPDQRIDYVLTTGANWSRPIGRFRLVVDKGAPGNLVSFCETGIRKISPTQFEVVKRDYRPTRDLNVLIVSPRN